MSGGGVWDVVARRDFIFRDSSFGQQYPNYNKTQASSI